MLHDLFDGYTRSVLIFAGIHVIVLTGLQIALGIFTVLSAVALPLAALHQIVALALFGTALWLIDVLRTEPQSRKQWE